MALNGLYRRPSSPLFSKRPATLSPTRGQNQQEWLLPVSSLQHSSAINSTTETCKQEENDRGGDVQPQSAISTSSPELSDVDFDFNKEYTSPRLQSHIFDFYMRPYSASPALSSHYHFALSGTHSTQGSNSTLCEFEGDPVVAQKWASSSLEVQQIKHSNDLKSSGTWSTAECNFSVERDLCHNSDTALLSEACRRKSTQDQGPLSYTCSTREVRATSDYWSVEKAFSPYIPVDKKDSASGKRGSLTSLWKKACKEKRRLSYCSKYVDQLKHTCRRRGSAPAATSVCPLPRNAAYTVHDSDVATCHDRELQAKCDSYTNLSDRKACPDMTRGTTTVWNDKKTPVFLRERQATHVYVLRSRRRKSCSCLYSSQRHLREDMEESVKVEMQLPIPVKRTIRDGLRGPTSFCGSSIFVNADAGLTPPVGEST